MPRRPDEAEHAAVEILDIEPSEATAPWPDEAVERGGGPNRWIGVVLVAAGVLATVGLVTAGNSPAPAPVDQSVTVPATEVPTTEGPTTEEPTTTTDTVRVLTLAEREEFYGVEIGVGPELIWQPVIWTIGTDEFRWIDGGFVGDDGQTEWTIRPGVLGPDIAQRQSLALSFPEYDLSLVDGGWLLQPREQPFDHVLVIAPGAEPVRIELPPIERNTDWLDTRRFVRGAVIGDRAVLVTATSTTRDETIPTVVSVHSMTDGSSEVLPIEPRLLEGPRRTSSGLAFAWLAGPDARFWATDDGVEWAEYGDLDPWSTDVTSAGLFELDPFRASLRFSTDDGATWTRTNAPATSPRQVQLGVEPVPQAMVDGVVVMVVESRNGPATRQLASVRWDGAAPDPEWQIEPIADVFSDATDVDFFEGDGYVLAMAATPTGPDFYVAATAER